MLAYLVLRLTLHVPQLRIHLILHRSQLRSDLLHSRLQLILQLVDEGFTSTAIYWCLEGHKKGIDPTHLDPSKTEF